MKRYTCVLILLAGILAVLVLPSTALAEVSHFRGKTAWLDFYSLDPTGCISTSVSVFATESRYQNPPGSPTSSAWADVGISQWNDCTWEYLSCAYGSVAYRTAPST